MRDIKDWDQFRIAYSNTKVKCGQVVNRNIFVEALEFADLQREHGG